MRRPHIQVTPSLVISLAALFVACGGSAIAATGGNFILGAANTADKPTLLTGTTSAGAALKVSNTSSLPAASFTAPAGVAPFTVSNNTKIAKLNADLLDGLDSAAFLRKAIPLVISGSDPTAALRVTNNGIGNGVQGVSNAGATSGVYGENDASGYGVAGRSNLLDGTALFGEAIGGGQSHGLVASTNGPGAAVLAINPAGPALDLQGLVPMTVNSTARVDNLNADMVDGASIASNRIISTTANDPILQIPGFGELDVVSCDHTNASFTWNSGGTVAYVAAYDLFHPSDALVGVRIGATFPPQVDSLVILQLARNTGSGTSIATVTVSATGFDCVFAGQAVVQPG